MSPPLTSGSDYLLELWINIIFCLISKSTDAKQMSRVICRDGEEWAEFYSNFCTWIIWGKIWGIIWGTMGPYHPPYYTIPHIVPLQPPTISSIISDILISSFTFCPSAPSPKPHHTPCHVSFPEFVWSDKTSEWSPQPGRSSGNQTGSFYRKMCLNGDLLTKRQREQWIIILILHCHSSPDFCMNTASYQILKHFPFTTLIQDNIRLSGYLDKNWSPHSWHEAGPLPTCHLKCLGHY